MDSRRLFSKTDFNSVMLVLHAFQTYTLAEKEYFYRTCNTNCAAINFFCNTVCVQVCIDNCGSSQQRYLVTCLSYKLKTATSNVLIPNLIKSYKSYILTENTSASVWEHLQLQKNILCCANPGHPSLT